MDLLLTEIFFKEQTRNVKNTKNDEKSMNVKKNVCSFCLRVRVAGSSPTVGVVLNLLSCGRYTFCFLCVGGRWFESCEEARFFSQRLGHITGSELEQNAI